MLAAGENKNPYEYSMHREDCSEDVWFDKDLGVLINLEEIAERECGACDQEYSIWDKIIEDTGNARYGDIVFAMLDLDNFIEVFRLRPQEISAIEWEYLSAVRSERNRRQAYLSWQANQPKN